MPQRFDRVVNPALIALAVLWLLALTGCEEMTRQNKNKQAAETERQQNQLRAEANRHKRELAFKQQQAREAGRLRLILQKEQHRQEQILRAKRQEYLAPIIKFVTVVLAGLITFVAAYFLGIKQYFAYLDKLADLENKTKVTLEKYRMLMEKIEVFSEEERALLLERFPEQLSLSAGS